MIYFVILLKSGCIIILLLLFLLRKHILLYFRLTRIVPAAVAIYPGDGTVIESAGATAMFFRHYVRKNEKVGQRDMFISMVYSLFLWYMCVIRL